MSDSLAIILARGGSKRLPHKNVIDFFGKPMFAWSVEAALQSGCFGRVIVSTDDRVIAEIAERHGAEAPFLRDAAADDSATASSASIIALRQAENHWGETYDFVAQLMANCPLRTAVDVREGVARFKKRGAAAHISCFNLGWSNPWWAAKTDVNGVPDYLFPDATTKRSQDLPPLYGPTGALWIARRDSLLKAGSFYTEGHRWHPLSRMSATDIDDEEDLLFARACFLVRNGRLDSSV